MTHSVIFILQYFTLFNHLKIIIHGEYSSFHQHYNNTEDNYSIITHDINSLNISIQTLVTLTHVMFDMTPTVLILSNDIGYIKQTT